MERIKTFISKFIHSRYFYIAIVSLLIVLTIIIYIVKKTKEASISTVIRTNDSTEVVFDEIRVEVKGEVMNPKIYSLPSGSRVEDAILKAGGFTNYADVTSVNLVKIVKDGDSIEVKRIETSTSNLININLATESDLMKLSGISSAKASAIITDREINGLFNSIEEIMRVNGISQATFDKIKDYITVK